MARASALATFCALAMLCCVALQCAVAFVPGPAARVSQSNVDVAVGMAGVAAATGLPGTANAFVYDGQEYFDITFGISPLYWGLAAFGIITYGAVIKNAALKYNKPYGTSTIVDPKPEKTDQFKGTIEEFGANAEAVGKYAGLASESKS